MEVRYINVRSEKGEKLINKDRTRTIRARKLSVTGAIGTELAFIRAGSGKFLDAAIANISYPDVSTGIDGEIPRPIKLSVTGATRTKLSYIGAGAGKFFNDIFI